MFLPPPVQTAGSSYEPIQSGCMQMKLKPIVTRTIRICRGVTTLPPFALPLRSDRNSHFGVSPDGVAFTGEGKLARKATGYEQEELKPRYPTSGSRAARAELQVPIGAYR